MNSFIETLKEIKDISQDELNEPDKDWFREWTKNAGRFSDEHFNILWGKVLAGEMRKPSSFSYRALDGLRNLSKDDANLILQISPFVTSGIIYKSNELVFNMGTTWGDCYLLEEMGIVKHVGSISTSISHKIDKDKIQLISGMKYSLILFSDSLKEISESVIILTELGSAIMGLIKNTFMEAPSLINTQEKYLNNLGEYFIKTYQIKYLFTETSYL